MIHSDLFISPQGNLHDDDATFLSGNGEGLFVLIQTENLTKFPGKLFFQKLFTERINTISSLDMRENLHIGKLLESVRPGTEECAMMLFSLPPILGAEYLNEKILHQYYIEFDNALIAHFDSFTGNFTDFLRGLSPLWKNVGKVTFHLAENKGDRTGDHPFAFMASFIWNPPGERPRNLPLAAALKAYSNDKLAMTSLLEPIAEAAKKSALLRNLLENRRIFQPSAWTSGEACDFLRDIPVYEKANITIRMTNLWKTRPPKIRVSVSLDTDKKTKLGADALLNFSVGVSLNGESLTRQEIDTLLKSSGGLIRLKGQWVEADPEKIKELLNSWQEAEEISKANGISLIEGMRLLSGAENTLFGKEINSADEDCEIQVGTALREILNRLTTPDRNELPPLPGNLREILRPYQLDGVKYLWFASSIGFGTCLADDMGLGKTLQILTLIKLWKQEKLLEKLPVLLVLPATLLANWQSEKEKFTPDLQMAVLHPSVLSHDEWKVFEEDPDKYLKRYEVVLTTYGMTSRLPQLKKLTFPAIIADEAQAIKNPSSAQSRAVRSLQSPRKIALTGTPIENRLSDLWSIFDFLNHGLLKDLKNFVSYTKRLDGDYSSLRKLTSPFILRRLKTDKRIIQDLPDKVENKVYCTLSKKQAALYSRCVDELAEALQEEGNGIKRKGIVLAYLMRFKQICNHPAQFSGTENFCPEDSGKFLCISNLAESIASRQEKVLVFTQFKEMTVPLLDYLEQCFQRPGLLLHGGTPVKERAKLVQTFQKEDGPPFFVLSLKAAGTGLNLTAANHVIHFDRWWNPAVENQASDRAYRIGQKRNVLIHKFICRGTLEEKIDALMSEKQQLADDILGGGAEKILTEMSTDEILNIVKLDPISNGE